VDSVTSGRLAATNPAPREMPRPARLVSAMSSPPQNGVARLVREPHAHDRRDRRTGTEAEGRLRDVVVVEVDLEAPGAGRAQPVAKVGSAQHVVERAAVQREDQLRHGPTVEADGLH